MSIEVNEQRCFILSCACLIVSIAMVRREFLRTFFATLVGFASVYIDMCVQFCFHCQYRFGGAIYIFNVSSIMGQWITQ